MRWAGVAGAKTPATKVSPGVEGGWGAAGGYMRRRFRSAVSSFKLKNQYKVGKAKRRMIMATEVSPQLGDCAGGVRAAARVVARARAAVAGRRLRGRRG